MNLHVAFCWSEEGGVQRFADVVISDYARSPRTLDDVQALRRQLDSMVGGEIVILGWTEMWPAGGGEP